jgi:hypothetical protein
MSVPTTEAPPFDPSTWTRKSLQAVPDPATPRRRARGLSLPVLPSWPLVAQVLGGTAALCGVWLRFGVPVALIVGGVALVLVGMLREAGKI